MSNAVLEALDVVEREAGDDCVEAELVVELFERETAEDRALGRARIDGGHVVTVGGKGESELAVSATDLEQTSRRRRKLRSREGVESLESQAHARSSESARAFCSSFPRSAWSSSSSSALNPASRRWLNACTARSISACFARPASVSSTLTARRSFGVAATYDEALLFETVDVARQRRAFDVERARELVLRPPLLALQVREDEPRRHRAADLGKRVVERAPDVLRRVGELQADRGSRWAHGRDSSVLIAS